MAAAAAEQGFFDTLQHTFEAVPLAADGGVETDSFLLACADIIPFLDALGSTAFAPVKADINGNIKKLRKRHLADPAGCGTLQAIVHKEIGAGTTRASGSATDALLWLQRALAFIRVFLREVAGGEPDINKAASTAYETTLRQHHKFLVRVIFSVAMRAVPTRAGLMEALGRGGTEEHTVARMQTYLAGMSSRLDAVQALYTAEGLGT